eukprot:gene14085-5073_t
MEDGVDGDPHNHAVKLAEEVSSCVTALVLIQARQMVVGLVPARRLCQVSVTYMAVQKNQIPKLLWHPVRTSLKLLTPQYNNLKASSNTLDLSSSSLVETSRFTVDNAVRYVDGTKYQLVGCFDNSVDRLKEMLITERDHTSHVWNGEWVDWDNWNSYMENSLNRCAVKAHSKKFRVFGMSYYAECWVDRTVSNAMATFTPDLKDLSKCVKEGYKDCSMGDTRCIGKHYGIAVYQIIEK